MELVLWTLTGLQLQPGRTSSDKDKDNKRFVRRRHTHNSCLAFDSPLALLRCSFS